MVSFRYLIAHFVSLSYTDWKFHDFSTTTRILRENNFGDFLSAKYAILTHLEPLNFDFHELLHFLKAEIDQNSKMAKFRTPKMAKTAVLEFLDSPKLISRKI